MRWWTVLGCGGRSPDVPDDAALLASSMPQEPEQSTAPTPPAPEPLSDGPFQRQLAEGLVVAAYLPPEIEAGSFSRTDPAAVASTDRRIFVVTIDPRRYEMVYLSSRDETLAGAQFMTASEWAERFDLQVAFNPGMFEPDGRATGYSRTGERVSQADVRRNGLYRGWFVAEPAEGSAPAAATLDQIPPKGEGRYGAFGELPAPFRERLAGYRIVSQSLSIVRGGLAVYPARESQWSELAFGTDREGNVIVVFSRYPYEMREFGARVAALELGIEALVHGEGGPEASLAVRAGGVMLDLCGSYETGFADDSNGSQWSLPAVMGVRPRTAR